MLQSLMNAFSPTQAQRPSGQEIVPQMGVQRFKQVETTTAFTWPTPIEPSIQTTTESIFPTLIGGNQERGGGLSLIT